MASGAKTRSKADLRNELKRAQTKLKTMAARTARSESMTTVVQSTVEASQKPSTDDLNPIFELCQQWHRDSDFLRTFFGLKHSVLNCDMRVVPALQKGKDPTDEDTQKLDEWMASLAASITEEFIEGDVTVKVESTSTNQERLENFTKDVWNDRILFQNVVGLWNDETPMAFVPPIEKTTYADLMGIETMKFTHGLAEIQIKNLPEKIRARYSEKKVIFFDVNEGEHFKVLKDSRTGEGYGVPDLYSLFRLLAEVDSKQLGMSRRAFLLRINARHHKVGYEIKQGPHAGKVFEHTGWNKKRDSAIKDKWKDQEGVMDFTSAHDHLIEFPWPDLKCFDKTAFEGSDIRLNNWGGPIALMIQARGVAPYLTPLLRAQATLERRRIGRYLSFIFKNAFKCPLDVDVEWSEAIFSEARLHAELVKYGVASGQLSVTTATREMGFNRKVERALKVKEAKEADIVATSSPMWDQAHGLRPALGESAMTVAEAKAKQTANGRPPGATDNLPRT